MQRIDISTPGIKFFIEEDGQEVARAFLYLISNDLHEALYGLMEDVFVHEDYRGRGHGNTVLTDLIAEAERRGCYKLIGTSRHERGHVHRWYEKLGFKNHGLEFRLEFD